MNNEINNDIEIAVINTKLDALKESVDSLAVTVHENNAAKVARGEWEMRNHYVDGKFQSMGREIGELRTEIRTEQNKVENRKPHWTSIVAVIVASIVLGLDLITQYVI